MSLHLVQQQLDERGALRVTCSWTPPHDKLPAYLQWTENVPGMDECLALAEPCDRAFSVSGMSTLSVMYRIASNVQARLIESTCRRVVLTVRELHWPWSARVTPQDLLRFELKYSAAAPPAGVQGVCHVWQAARSVGGQKTSNGLPYGRFWVGGHSVPAHIFAAVMLPRPDGLPHMPGSEVDHLCQNSLCVQPLHLESVPPEVNQDRVRTRAVKEHQSAWADQW